MHIEIKHHFMIDYVQKYVIDIQFSDTGHQWVDKFTKHLGCNPAIASASQA